MLAHYSAEVVKAVTDPFSGLPARKSESGWSGLPDVADVKEACQAEADSQARMASYRKQGPTNFKRLPRLRGAPGSLANALIARNHPAYQRMVERVQTETDDRFWKMDEKTGGIWIALNWLDEPPKKLSRFKQFSDDDLRKMYEIPNAPERA